MKKITAMFFMGLILTLSVGVYAQKNLQIYKTTNVPVIDGTLEDEVWLQTTGDKFSWNADMTPVDGLTASFRATYDENALYVAVTVIDPEVVDNDEVGISVDLGPEKSIDIGWEGDPKDDDGFLFSKITIAEGSVTARGVQYGVATTDTGYIIEMALPFSEITTEQTIIDNAIQNNTFWMDLGIKNNGDDASLLGWSHDDNSYWNSSQKSGVITLAPPLTVITSFEEDFENGEIWEGWDTEARSHTLAEQNGVLTITVDKPTSAEKWDGITMGFGENTLLDLSKNGGYFSVKLKADADCKVDIALIDAFNTNNTGRNQIQLTGGDDWKTMEYTFAGDGLLKLKWNGDTLGYVDATMIDKLLMTFNGGSAWTGTVMMDDMEIGDAAIPPTKITTFEDDFEGETIWEGWDTESETHSLTQADGILTIAVDKTDAQKWNGLTMGFGENTLLDLSENGGYFSVKLKSDADCTVDIALWDENGEYNPGNNKVELTGGDDWAIMTYEFAGDNLIHYKWNGDVLGTVDASLVHHLLMTFNGGSAWTGTVMMDDMEIGDAAIPPTKITTFEDDFEGETLWEGWDTESETHSLTQADGILTIAVDKTDAQKWNGLTMGFGENTLLDLTGNGVFSVKLKSDADCTVDIALWDENGEYNPGNNKIELIGGDDWVTMIYEFAGDNLIHYKWNGDVLGTVDASLVHHLLMTFNGGSAWTGTVMMDDMVIGKGEIVKDNDATLKALTLEGLTLDPAFSADVTSYTVSVMEGDELPPVTAEVNSSKAGVEINTPDELPGTVSVIVTAEDGTTKEYTVEVSVVSGIKEANAYHFNIWPNPGQNILFVNSKERITGIQILDITGKTIKKLRIYDSNINLDISDLTTGFYFIKLKNGENKSAVKQFIKK